jgi:hypothetical protein
MVFGYFRFELDACPYVLRFIQCIARSVVAMPASLLMSMSASIKRVAWLLVSGVLVCTCLTACGGRDDDSRAVSSTASQDGSQSGSQSDSQSESQRPPQLDSSTVANAAPPASGALVPPVMHYAQ